VRALQSPRKRVEFCTKLSRRQASSKLRFAGERRGAPAARLGRTVIGPSGARGSPLLDPTRRAQSAQSLELGALANQSARPSGRRRPCIHSGAQIARSHERHPALAGCQLRATGRSLAQTAATAQGPEYTMQLIGPSIQTQTQAPAPPTCHYLTISPYLCPPKTRPNKPPHLLSLQLQRPLAKVPLRCRALPAFWPAKRRRLHRLPRQHSRPLLPLLQRGLHSRPLEAHERQGGLQA